MWEFCWLLGKFCHGYQNQIYFALIKKSLLVCVSLRYVQNQIYICEYVWFLTLFHVTFWCNFVEKKTIFTPTYQVCCYGNHMKQCFSPKKYLHMNLPWPNLPNGTIILLLLNKSLNHIFACILPHVLCTHIILIPFIMCMDLFALLSHKWCHFKCIIDALRPNTCTNLTSNDQCTRRIGLSLTRIYEDLYAHLLHWHML